MITGGCGDLVWCSPGIVKISCEWIFVDVFRGHDYGLLVGYGGRAEDAGVDVSRFVGGDECADTR